MGVGTQQCGCLRCCATSRRSRIWLGWGHWNFEFIYTFEPHYGPGIDSVCKRNDYHEISCSKGLPARRVMSQPSVSWLSGTVICSHFCSRTPRRFLFNFLLPELCVYNSSYAQSVKSYSSNKPLRPTSLWDIEDPTLSRQSAHRWRWDSQPHAQVALYSPDIFFV
jgi:hypothetical protein